MYSFFKQCNADVIFLQETHVTTETLKVIKNEWRGLWINSAGTTAARGVSILLSKEITDMASDIHMWSDANGRLLTCSLTLEERSILLCNVYGCNVDNPEVFTELAEKLNNMTAESIIIGGDFNFVMEHNKDSKYRLHSHPKTREVVNQLIEDLDMVDIWRVRNPDLFNFTWRKLKPKRTFSRLDWFLVDTGTSTLVTECGMKQVSFTDHKCIYITIGFNKYSRGPGVWKLNNLHLSKETFKTGIHNTVSSAVKNGGSLPADEKWDFIKSEIIEFCKYFSKKEAHGENIHKLNLEKTLEMLNIDATQNTHLKEISEAINHIESELENIARKKIQSSIFRSKVVNLRDWEKNSKYFFGLEKRRYLCKNIKVISKNGVLIKEQSRILQEQAKFYKDLYTKNDSVRFRLTPHKNETLLNHEQIEFLSESITLNEIREALFSMPNGKCPGLDGLSKEFYAEFFELLGPLLLNLYTYCHEQGRLNQSSRTGLITLIPKRERNLTELKSWRPLSILCVDYKILSKTLAERMKKVLPSIVSEEQTGFVPGRLISENIRRTIEVIEFTKKKQIPSIIMSLDFEKCFDKIEHQSIYDSLAYFKFPKRYIDWIKLFFTEMIIYTQNFGFLSPAFKKERGCNQGCNISPFCFIICGEIMSRKLKQNCKIEGIRMSDGKTALLSQFADDTVLYLTYDKITLESTISTLAVIEANTGLTINYDKTLIYRTGSLANSNAKIYTSREFNWTNEPFNMLGVTIANDMRECTTNNFENVITKMQATMDKWMNRQLTIMGRILILNTLCESLFVYKLTVLSDINAAMIQKIDKISTNFLWKGKKARIAKETLKASKSNAGLRMFDISKKQTALKVQWFVKATKKSFYKSCFFDSIQLPETDFTFLCNLHSKDCELYGDRNDFWCQVLMHWCDVTFTEPQTLDELLPTVLWFNSCVRIKNKPIYFF